MHKILQLQVGTNRIVFGSNRFYSNRIELPESSKPPRLKKQHYVNEIFMRFDITGLENKSFRVFCTPFLNMSQIKWSNN